MEWKQRKVAITDSYLRPAGGNMYVKVSPVRSAANAPDAAREQGVDVDGMGPRALQHYTTCCRKAIRRSQPSCGVEAGPRAVVYVHVGTEDSAFPGMPSNSYHADLPVKPVLAYMADTTAGSGSHEHSFGCRPERPSLLSIIDSSAESDRAYSLRILCLDCRGYVWCIERTPPVEVDHVANS